MAEANKITKSFKHWFGLDTDAPHRRSAVTTYPLAFLAIYLVLFAYYYMFWVPQQQAELINHGFRVLALTAEQIHSVILNFAIISRTQAEGEAKGFRDISKRRIEAFSEHMLPEECPVDSTPLSGGMEVALAPQQSTFALMMRFQYQDPNSRNTSSLCGRATIQDAVATFATQVPHDIFDDVVIVDARGRVLYQKEQTVFRLADISVLLDQAELSKPAAQAPTSEISDAFSKMLGRRSLATVAFTKVSDITLAGAKYKMLMQPISFAIPEIADGEKPNPDFRLILCGFMSSDRLNSRSKVLPNRWLVYMFCLIAIGLMSLWPFLKLKTMAATEGFQARELLWFAFSILMAARVLTVLILYATQVESKAMEPYLEELAKNIEQNFQSELDLALATLHSYSNSDELVRGAGRVRVPKLDDWQPTNLLSVDNRSRIAYRWYPYFDQVFWTARDPEDMGYQRVKWTVQQKRTGQTYARGLDWYDQFNSGRFWIFEDDAWLNSRLKQVGGNPKFLLDSIYSPNTGEYVAVLAQPLTKSNLPSLKAAVMVTPLMSVVSPVIPPGFGFALIDQDGTVLFHSDSNLNRRENFFQEIEGERQLRVAVLSGGSHFMEGNYEGRDRYVYLRPLKLIRNSGWSLIVFLDAEARNHFYLDVFLLTLICSLAFATWNSGLVLLGSRLLSRMNNHWHWPERGKLWILNLLLIIYFLMFVGLGYVYMAAPPWLTSLLVWCLPPIALGAVYVAFAAHYCQRRWWKQVLRQVQSTVPESITNLFAFPVQRVGPAYVTVAWMLIVLLGVVPCVIFFKQAFRQERLFYGANHQLELESRLEDRRQRIQNYYSKVKTNILDGPITDEVFVDRRLRENLDRYDLIWRQAAPVIDPSPSPNRELANLSADPLTAAFLPLATDVPHPLSASEQMKENARWLWSLPEPNRLLIQNSDHDPEKKLLLDLPIYRVPIRIARALLVLLVVGLFGLLRYTASHRFIVNFDPTDRWPEFTIPPIQSIDENLLLVGWPRSGKTELLKRRKDCAFIDITERIGTNDWSLPADLGDGVHKVAVVDEFQYGIDDSKLNQKKLELVEELVRRRDIKVIILSTVDPMFYLFEEYFDPYATPTPNNDVYQAATVLSSFQKQVIPSKPQKPDQECYQLLWATCSLRERIALSQLAEDGTVNPKNWFALKHLNARHLVDETHPGEGIFRITDKGFSDYVRTELPKKLILSLRKSEKDLAWNGSKRVIMLTVFAAVVFLVTAWQDYLKAGLGQVTGLLTVVSAIITFLPNSLLPGLARFAMRLRASSKDSIDA